MKIIRNQMKIKNSRSLVMALAVMFLVGLSVNAVLAKNTPKVKSKYEKYFYHYADKRSYLEKSLNVIGLTNQDLGRSFALIAGVCVFLP